MLRKVAARWNASGYRTRAQGRWISWSSWSSWSIFVVAQIFPGTFGSFDACLGRAGVFDLVGQILHAAIAETNVLAKDSRRIQNDQ